MEFKKLTGNTRYRIHQRFFKEPLVVLQVEVYTKGVYYDHSDPLYYTGRPYEKTSYRDATFEDLQELNIINKE